MEPAVLWPIGLLLAAWSRHAPAVIAWRRHERKTA
jgi:hypothetical protein